MRRFVATRLLHAVVVLFVVTTIAFFLLHLAPGDPFALDGPRMTPDLRDRLRAQFGYDRPLLEQYGRYLMNVARGELGWSHSLQAPVSRVLAQAIPATLLLMSVSMVLGFACGAWLGTVEIRRLGRRSADAVNALSLVLYSVPSFWLALMLLLAFAYWLPWLPAGGMTDVILHDYMAPGPAAWDRARHLVLPVLSLTLVIAATVARYQRASLLEVLPADWVRTARAKGVAERDVVRRHALRNALLPMITIVGMSFPSLLGGAVFVERVFAWPGMGLLVTNAVASRDYAVVLAAVIAGGVMVVVGNLLADIGYGLADPRVRVS